MKLIRKLFSLLLILMVIGAVTSAFMMVEDSPSVSSALSLNPGDLRRAEVFMENTDPRKLAPGEVSAFTIEQQDLELLLNYGLDQLEGGGARVYLREGLADVAISARLPDNPLGDYLNVELALSQWGDMLNVEHLKLGGINIPGAFADSVIGFAHEQLQVVPEYVAALDAINGYSIGNERLNVVYQWQPDLVEQLSNRGRDLLVSAEDQERLLAHASNLSSITNSAGIASVDSLAKVVSPMFLFANARGGDPVAENRAAITVMAMHIMGINVARVLGLPNDTIPPAGRHKFTLSERGDFAQHFLVSAGLTVTAGTGLADSIGLLKELEDSDGGSGFSFTDIGADRTGVRFAEVATANRESAMAVQNLLMGSDAESVFMAEFRDLPESMPRETFERLYGGVGEPAYQRVMEDIEARITRAPMFASL